MRTGEKHHAGYIQRLLFSSALILLSGCSTSNSGSVAGNDRIAATPATESTGSKSGYVDPLVANASRPRAARAANPDEAPYVAPSDPVGQDIGDEDGLANAVTRPNAIKAGSSSIYSTNAPEYEPEEGPATGPVPAYIPPTGINATRGSVFSTRQPPQ